MKGEESVDQCREISVGEGQVKGGLSRNGAEHRLQVA